MTKLLKYSLAAVVTLAIAPAGAQAWAPADTAPIHPGVQLYTQGAQCTANFIYGDEGGAYHRPGRPLLEQGRRTPTPTGAPRRTTAPGRPVEIDGSDGNTYSGTIVYSSWETMQAHGETDADACQYNDLELVKLDPRDASKVNPCVPFWGGPTGGVGTASPGGDDVYSYGNSSLRAGITALSPKQGKVAC